ncbi:MerR family transcriptional regulator [Roseateles saccharophilus]|uniref:DNA-binding transcriptional MerR regulator n=1 Tax=Roseateles saccharophilus TaxID=304 RepID=A0A4R3UPM1_ROSSA|nr:MerR family transcriptional regulator [Roseateles saccharophilus]MDG0835501.1 MerR family transcriptional regulator [Roseateles saccharophilus]TCU92691.1 DNA-binding transcriptional MerR regulator [Roseateles saccharophilus]
MFRIGDFSRIARVSARLLRFYDELGLFVPAHADASSCYRYYTLAQLAQLNRITVLKELGFSLDQVRDILKSQVSAAELRSMLLQRRNHAERALAAEVQRLRHIETRIAQIEADGRLSSEDVVVRAEPAHRLLSMRHRVASFGEAQEMIGLLRQLVRPILPKRHGGPLVVVAHSLQFDQEALDLEFGFALDTDAAVALPRGSVLTWSELPAIERMAVCVRTGGPEDAHLVTARIGAFLAQNGDALDGPGRELFLRLPEPDAMHESVVEMQFPIRPASPRAGP